MIIQYRNTEIHQNVLVEENHTLTSENPKSVPIAMCQEILRCSIVFHIGDVTLNVNHRKTELKVPKTDVL